MTLGQSLTISNVVAYSKHYQLWSWPLRVTGKRIPEGSKKIIPNKENVNFFIDYRVEPLKIRLEGSFEGRGTGKTLLTRKGYQMKKSELDRRIEALNQKIENLVHWASEEMERKNYAISTIHSCEANALKIAIDFLLSTDGTDDDLWGFSITD